MNVNLTEMDFVIMVLFLLGSNAQNTHQKEDAMKYDNTVKDFSKYGGVWCQATENQEQDCYHWVPKSMFSMYPRCSKYGWRMDMRAGVYMSGCCQGSINKQTKRIN